MNKSRLFLQVSHREAPHTISKSYLANPFSDMMEQIPPRLHWQADMRLHLSQQRIACGFFLTHFLASL